MSKRRAWLICLLLSACSCASAPISSNGFLTLHATGSQVTGSLEIAVRDAELAVGLDTNGDGTVTCGEARSRELPLKSYVRERLALAGDGNTCSTEFGELQVNARVDGNYLWLPFTATCGGAVREISIDYRLLKEVDPSHRGLLTLGAWGTTQSGVLTPGHGRQTFTLGRPQPLRAFAEYLSIGVWHIWSGIDHLLFLLSLLLPAVLRRRGGQWE